MIAISSAMDLRDRVMSATWDSVPAGAQSDAQISKVASEFDAIVLRQMLESILPESKSGMYGGGSAGGVWRSMMADQIAGLLSKSDILGVRATSKTGYGIRA